VIRALLWDVDGTLAETERDGHRVAFNQAFAAAGVPWRWSVERYGALLAISGGRERLLHDMDTQPAAPHGAAARDELARRLHALKNDCYAALVARGAVRLRAGVAALLEDCQRRGVALGIVTTTSRCNVAALLARVLGAGWAARFAVTVCAEEAPRKKPDPQAYALALAALGLASAEVVALEDSPAGIAAAQRAGIAAVHTRSYYFPDVPLAPLLAAGPSLGQTEGWHPAAARAERVSLAQLERWHCAPRRVS